jgi:hypothetical protein
VRSRSKHPPSAKLSNVKRVVEFVDIFNIFLIVN